MAAMCMLFGIEPKKGGAANKRDDDYWEPAKKRILDDPKIARRIETFDKDAIPEEVSAKLRPLLNNPNFDVGKITNSSAAGGIFARWVQCLEKYDRTRQEIKPKREALVVAEASLDVGTDELNKRQEKLTLTQQELADLQSQHTAVGIRRHGMEEQVCPLRLLVLIHCPCRLEL
jgi:dynein heavy chain